MSERSPRAESASTTTTTTEGPTPAAEMEGRTREGGATPAASMCSGRVEGGAEDYVSVRVAGGRSVLARRATSCLVEPITGDRVLLAEEDDSAFVLAVLERESGVATTLSTAGDLEIAPTGKLTITAPAGVHVATARDLTLAARTIETVADEAHLIWRTIRVAGRSLSAEIQRVEVVADESTSIVGRIFQRAKRVFRSVEEGETLRTGQLDVLAETNLRMHGETALVTANDLVKVDGKQIQLG